jgi:tetratricopeptide (TPR) repeat protein
MPAEGDLPFRIGLVHTMNGQLAKAEQALRRAIELAPDRATFRVALGGCLVQQGRNQEAIDILRPILQQAPTADDMVKARAITDRMFDPLRGLDPETSQDLQRAMDALDQDAIQEALVLVEKLVLQRPELAFAHLLKGLAHSRMENNGEAIIALERSVELNPHSPTAWAAIGDVYLRTEKWAKARECYERALDLNPLDTQAIERLGEWAITRQDAERAVRAFSSLALLEPSRMEYRLRWAMALVQADRIPEALTVYQGILRLEKHNLVALMRAGSLVVVMAQRDTAAHQAHMDAARRYLEEAHRAAPENKAVQDMLDKLKE